MNQRLAALCIILLVPLLGGLLTILPQRSATQSAPPARSAIAADGPAARSNPALIRDDASGVVWLVAGLTEAGYAADLWTLDLAGETPIWGETAQASGAPEPRASHDATLLDGVVYLFGGYGNGGPLADFWRLESAG